MTAHSCQAGQRRSRVQAIPGFPPSDVSRCAGRESLGELCGLRIRTADSEQPPQVCPQTSSLPLRQSFWQRQHRSAKDLETFSRETVQMFHDFNV